MTVHPPKHVVLSVYQRIAVAILRDTDITALIGTEFCVGYGTSDTEMLTAGGYRGAYKVP